MSFYVFLYLFHKQCTFLRIFKYFCTSTNVLLIKYTSAYQHGVSLLEWIRFWTNQVNKWLHSPFRWTHLLSFYLNQPFWTNRWILYDFLKHGLAITYWRVYCHQYLSMTFLNQTTCQHYQHKNSHQNIDQKSSISGTRKKGL